MSVRRRGKRFEVRWTEGGRKLSRSFLRAEDARAFDLDIKRRKQLGALAPGIIQSRQTLAEFVEAEWWPRYAIPNLAPETRRRYLEVWGAHLLPRLGDYELREITPDGGRGPTGPDDAREGGRTHAAQGADAAPGHP